MCCYGNYFTYVMLGINFYLKRFPFEGPSNSVTVMEKRPNSYTECLEKNEMEINRLSCRIY